MSANQVAENQIVDPFMRKLWRQPLPANTPVDILILKSAGESAKTPEVIEVARKKGRLGRVIEIESLNGRDLGQILTGLITEIQSPAFIITEEESGWNRDILDRLLDGINKVDIVIGSRVPAGRRMKWSQWLWATVRGVFWGAGVRDPHSPYRIFRTSIFRQFPLQSSSRFVDVEMIAKCNFLDGLIEENPFPVSDSWPGLIKLDHSRKDRKKLFKSPQFKFEEF